jgi:hypothetical protein
VPHRRGSFREDWNDLLIRFAQRRRHDEPRRNGLEQAEAKAGQSDLGDRSDPHKTLLERSSR